MNGAPVYLNNSKQMMIFKGKRGNWKFTKAKPWDKIVKNEDVPRKAEV